MVFDRIHFAKENVVEIIQLTEDNFLVIASSCLRNFSLNIPFAREIFRSTNPN